MRLSDVEAIGFYITYKDTDLRPKKTECVIERTNRERHGLSVRATSAPGVPAVSAPLLHTQTNTPEPIHRDWAREWKELSQEFKAYIPHSTLRADWHHTSAGDGWRVTGTDLQIVHAVEVLCRNAGRLLTSSPKIAANLPDAIKLLPEPRERWLYYLKQKGSFYKSKFVGAEQFQDGSRFHAYGGSIDGLVMVSANECLDCSGQEF